MPGPPAEYKPKLAIFLMMGSYGDRATAHDPLLVAEPLAHDALMVGELTPHRLAIPEGTQLAGVLSGEIASALGLPVLYPYVKECMYVVCRIIPTMLCRCHLIIRGIYNKCPNILMCASNALDGMRAFDFDTRTSAYVSKTYLHTHT